MSVFSFAHTLAGLAAVGPLATLRPYTCGTTISPRPGSRQTRISTP